MKLITQYQNNTKLENKEISRKKYKEIIEGKIINRDCTISN